MEALSMRKLGQALGRDPMRLYHHTESKAALLDAVAELVLEGLSVPPTSGGDWEQALRLAAQSFRKIAVDHPRMVPFLLTRPLALTPALLPTSGLRWVEGLLALLADAGFDQTGALQAYRFYTGFLVGHILHEVHDLTKDSGSSPVFPRLGVDFMTHQRYPRILALGPALAAETGDLELILGMDMVLMALRRQLNAIIDTHQLEK
ncbi:AcrR family transcriptional regulator [Nakamurella sp. UYEF19]